MFIRFGTVKAKMIVSKHRCLPFSLFVYISFNSNHIKVATRKTKQRHIVYEQLFQI